MARSLVLAVAIWCLAVRFAAADECFVYDSAHGSGPSGLCKPIACKDAGVLTAFKAVDACCGELVKLLPSQNKGACTSKSIEVFKIGAPKPAPVAPPPAGSCFVYDSAHGSGPSGLCKPIACKDAGVLTAFKAVDACCGELVKLLPSQNKGACTSKSIEVFKIGGAPPAGAKFNVKKDSDIKAADLKKGDAAFYKVCGPVAAVQAECAKTKGCVAFTYETARRADGSPQCGYLKGAAKDLAGRKGWDVYVKA